MDGKEQMIKHILEHLEMLSPELRKAVCWLILNIEYVDELPDNSFAYLEKEQCIQELLEKGQYLTAVIVQYKWLQSMNDKDYE